jgi:hypothetical protein
VADADLGVTVNGDWPRVVHLAPRRRAGRLAVRSARRRGAPCRAPCRAISQTQRGAVPGALPCDQPDAEGLPGRRLWGLCQQGRLGEGGAGQSAGLDPRQPLGDRPNGQNGHTIQARASKRAAACGGERRCSRRGRSEGTASVGIHHAVMDGATRTRSWWG